MAFDSGNKSNNAGKYGGKIENAGCMGLVVSIFLC